MASSTQEILRHGVKPRTGLVHRGRAVLRIAAAMAAIAALADPARAQSTGTQPIPAPAAEEITVTAAKRAQKLHLVPQSIAAISGTQLDAIGASGYRDYIDSIPGLNATSTGTGGARYNIRGISALSAANNDIATVGYYLDEVPISESQIGADIVPFDLERIEVLRGPQGTLYGEGSIGGTIKVVTNKPDLARDTGAVRTTLSDTAHGGFNQAVSAMLNVPLLRNQLAVRGVITESNDSGYLDNIITGRSNVNSVQKDEARLALRWRPLQELTIDISGLVGYEHDGGRNLDFALAGDTVPNIEDIAGSLGDGRLSPLAQVSNTAPAYSTISQFPEKFTTHRDIVNGTISDDLGWADLLSSSSYYRLQHNNFFDSREDGQTVEVQAAAIGLPAAGGGPLILAQGTRADVVSASRQVAQEFRLTSKADQPLRWLAGAFYRNRTNSFAYGENAPDTTQALARIGVDAPFIFNADQKVDFTQYAVFADATYDITRRLHLTAGTRLFIEDVHGSGVVSILNTFDFSRPFLRPLSFPAAGSQDQKDALFHVALAYDLTPLLSGYLLYSEGSRPGGLNQRLLTPYLPQFFRADSTRNYEAGVKGAFLGRRLSLNAALFQINWSDTQLYVDVPAGGQNIYNVPDGARVRGAELEIAYSVSPDVSLGGSYGYLDGQTIGALTYFNSLTGPTTSVIPAGFALPNVPRNKLSLFAAYAHRWGDNRVNARISDDYVASSSPAFGASYLLQPYNKLNMEASYTRHAWTLSLFANNLLDRIIEVGSAGAVPGSFGIGIDQPRTVGLRLEAGF